MCHRNGSTNCESTFEISVVNKESVSMVVSRQFITDIVATLDNLSHSLVKQVARGLLNIVQSRLISYEEQVIHHLFHTSLFVLYLTVEANFSKGSSHRL